MPEPKLSSVETGVFLHQEELVPELPGCTEIETWIRQIMRQESRHLHSVYYVFLSDEALLHINREFLQHDFYTDIITFPYAVNPVEAEIYISHERVRANAVQYNVSFKEELLRVMAHGILHLCDWDDHATGSAQLMRRREDACLVLLGVISDDYAVSPS